MTADMGSPSGEGRRGEGGTVELHFGDEPGGRVGGSIRIFDPPRVLEYDRRFEELLPLYAAQS